MEIQEPAVAVVQEPSVAVAIVDSHGYRIGESFGEEQMLTMVALASEDPVCWEDMEAAWPRYRTPAVPEFISGLPIEKVDRNVVAALLNSGGAWLVIDLVQKRIVTGTGCPEVERDAELHVADEGSRLNRCSFGVHLPPWWEHHEDADAALVFGERATPIAVPTCNRQVLYGEPLLCDLAERMLRQFAALSVKGPAALEELRSRHDMTVRVHRDWLMSPREDLGSKTPREQLHGAHAWLEQIISTQQMRSVQGNVLDALPSDFSGYETAPMDFVELLIYFDLCRELISAGWIWCRNVGLRLDKSMSRIPLEAHRSLVEFLRDIQSQWLHETDEDGLSPAYIIECSRRRVPCGSGIKIRGLENQPGERHSGNCDCPICNLMADNAFGPSFIMFDGYHLELDDEFAFSAHATREEWEEARDEDSDFDIDLLDTSEDPGSADSASDTMLKAGAMTSDAAAACAEDEFAPVWSNSMGSDPLPGDPQGFLKFAFLLAEIISLLQSADAGRDEVQNLNQLFTRFRQSDEASLVSSSRRLSEALEASATQFPQLVSRVADFQSKLDEHIRARASGADCDSSV